MPYNFTLPRDDDYITKGFQEGVQLGVRGSALALERRKLDQDAAARREALELERLKLDQDAASRFETLSLNRRKLDQDESYRRALLQERALERQQEQEQLRALSELSSSFPMGVGGAQQAQTYDEAIREFSTPSAPSASPSDIVVQQNEWMAANAPKFLALKDGPRVLSALGAISDNYRQTIGAFRSRIADTKVAQDRYEVVTRYGEDTPENWSKLYTGRSIGQIQEFFTKNKIPFQEIPEGIIEPSGFINEVNFHNWVTRVQRELPQKPQSTVASERAIEKVMELRRRVASATSPEEDKALREELALWEGNVPGAEKGNVTELEKIRFSAINAEMQSKLRELNQINAALATEDVKDKKGQFTERGTLLMRRKRLAEESIEDLKRNLFADGAPVEATTQTPASERPSNVPPNYVRARHKTTGQLGWADPNDPDVEIIQP